MLRHSLLSLALFFSFQALPFPGLEEIHDFGPNPGNLALFQNTTNLTNLEGAERPLVIALHGCNQSAGALARTSDWNRLAEEHDFYIIYPEQKLLNNPSRCFNWFREKDFKGHRGELASIHEMVKYMFKNYAIDSSKVFIYGLSAGAAMSVAYMANHPEIIEAGAIFAGSAYGMASNGAEGVKRMMKPLRLSEEEWVNRFKAARTDYEGDYPRLIAVHGSGDRIVDLGNSFQLVKQFAGLHQATTSSSKTGLADDEQIDRKVYLDSMGVEKVVFYLIDDLGHQLAVDPGTDSLQGGRTGAFARDIDFFSTYHVANDFGLLKSR